MSYAGCPGPSVPFGCNSLLKCVSQAEIAKKCTKNPYFVGSRSFQVIDIDTNKKLFTIACLCLSATVYTLHEIIAVK